MAMLIAWQTVNAVRRPGTRLLCEQVIGRALRRQSCDLNEKGRFGVEYTDVLGMPFDTKRLLETKCRDPGGEPKLHLFGQLKRITRQWLKDHPVCKGGTYPAQLVYQSLADLACERLQRRPPRP